MPPTDPAQPARVWPPTAAAPGKMHLHIHQRNVDQALIDALDAEVARRKAAGFTASKGNASRGALIIEILEVWYANRAPAPADQLQRPPAA